MRNQISGELIMVNDSESRPASIDEIKAEIRRTSSRPKRRLRRIRTDSLETALDQIIRAKTAGARASIRPGFVARVLKELLDRRREERELISEVNEIFADDGIMITDDPEPKIEVEEVQSLSELGNSSWESGSDLEKIEWKKPDTPDTPDELDESNVIHETHHRPILRANRRIGSGMHIHGRWQDETTTRQVVIYALLIIIVLTFGSLLTVF